MAENRITRSRVKNHMTYSWWKYLIAIVLCAMGSNLYFTMTAYRPPAEKKIEFYAVNDSVDQIGLEEDFWPVLQAACPEQELFSVISVNLSQEDPYAMMQFVTYTAAGQGDIFLLPASQIQRATASGADNMLLELTPFIESGLIDTQDIDLTRGMLPAESGEMGLYAIPADSLYGLLQFRNNPKNSYLCITAYSGNPETAAKAINLMIERYRTEPPADYEQQPESAAPIF